MIRFSNKRALAITSQGLIRWKAGYRRERQLTAMTSRHYGEAFSLTSLRVIFLAVKTIVQHKMNQFSNWRVDVSEA